MFCNYCTFQEILKRDVFHLGMKSIKNENIASAKPGSPLAGTERKASWLHIRVTTNKEIL